MELNGKSLVETARNTAIELHGTQLYGDLPYERHLADVVEVLLRFGFDSPESIAGGWLHDTLEDTKGTRESLAQLGIPAGVIATVAAVTDEPGANRKERKALTYPKIAASPEAIALKLADRIANVEAGARNGKRSMYAAEQPGFRAALYRPDPKTDPMWIHLEGCLLLCATAHAIVPEASRPDELSLR